MTSIAIVAGMMTDCLKGSFDYYIGVDRGAYYLKENHLPCHLAIGDFDSITNDELAQIRSYADQTMMANPQKNDTDLELALKECFKRFPKAQVSIFGAIGGRLDHSLSTLFLPSHPDLYPYLKQITIENHQNKVSYFPSGHFWLEPVNDKPYIAFLTEDMRELTILGAQYPLTNSNYFKRKIYVSNAFKEKTPIEVFFKGDYLIVIYSRDDRGD